MSIFQFLIRFPVFAILVLVRCSEQSSALQKQMEVNRNRSIFVYGRSHSDYFTKLYNANIFEKFNIRKSIVNVSGGMEYAVMNESVLRRIGGGLGYCVIEIEVDASDSDVLFSLLVS
jgi:hypothetical protein